MTQPPPNPIGVPPLPRCPQCGETEECAGDQRWQHDRDYRSSEATWMREAQGPAYAFRSGALEVTR